MPTRGRTPGAPRAAGLLLLALSLAGLLLASWGALSSGRVAVARLEAPRVMVEYGEGLALLGAEHLRERGYRGTYPPNLSDPPLQLSPYPPVLYTLWALLAGLLDRPADFLAGRLIGALGWLGIAGLVFALGRAVGAPGLTAATAGLALLTAPVSVQWLATARVDAPAVACALLGLYWVVRPPLRSGPAALIPASLAFALAVGFKQSALAAPSAALLHLLLEGRRGAALRLGLGLAGVGVLSAAAFAALTGGGVFVGTLDPLRQDVDHGRGLASLAGFVGAAPLPALATALAAPLLWLGWRGPARLATLYWLLACALCAATAGKVGANTNYGIEPVAATFLAASVGLGLLAERLGRVGAGPLQAAGARTVAPLLTLVLGAGALAEVPRLEAVLEATRRRNEAFPERIGLPDAPGYVMANPGLLPLIALPASRFYWNDPWSFALFASLGQADPEVVAEDLRSGAVGLIVTDVPLARQPLGEPRFPGDFERGFGPWHVPAWLEAARESFRPVSYPGGLHVYRYRPD